MFYMDVPDKKNNNWTSKLTAFIPTKTPQHNITKTTNKKDDNFLTSKKTDRQTDRRRDRRTDCCRNPTADRNATAGVGCVSTVAGTLPGSCSSCQVLRDKCGTDRLGEHDPCTLRLHPPIHTPNSSKWLQCYHSWKYMHLVQCLLQDTCPELNWWC